MAIILAKYRFLCYALDMKSSLAINGPMRGKRYYYPDETTKIQDYVLGLGWMMQMIYYRTHSGWALYSWRIYEV